MQVAKISSRNYPPVLLKIIEYYCLEVLLNFRIFILHVFKNFVAFHQFVKKTSGIYLVIFHFLRFHRLLSKSSFSRF